MALGLQLKDMEAYACNPSYFSGGNRRIMV
jgi:hypothetical protein